MLFIIYEVQPKKRKNRHGKDTSHSLIWNMMATEGAHQTLNMRAEG